jgi:tetratricopeptide (TPR) repeat protein
MKHLSITELLRACEAGRAEVKRVAAHLGVCPACRALAVRLLENPAVPAKREAPLKSLFEFAGFERGVAVEQLLARAEFTDLARQTRAAQKQQVIQSPSFHSPEFIDLLVAAVRAPHPRDEAEFLSSIAVLAVQRMQDKKNPPAFRNDLLGTIWTETANARRIHGEWSNALIALDRAEHYLEAGTGSSLLKTRRLSIAASLQSDQGAHDEAMASLAECLAIYEAERDWPLVARTLVKMANYLVDYEPARGLALLDQASVFIPLDDPTLRWLAESNRAECLVTMGRTEEALAAFSEAERMRPLQQRPNGSIRSTFTAARLLELLGYQQEAEILFIEALTGDLEAGLHRDALLDLLYIFGSHARRGDPERAAELSLRTLREIERQNTVLHDQLRSVWTKLINAARTEALDENMLLAAGEYFRAHWKYPAAAEPVLAGKPTSFRLGDTSVAGDEKLIAPLLARALWFRVRRDTRKNQQARVAASPECHTRTFAELLLAQLRAAPSRDEAEFIASLALSAAKAMPELAAFAEDFRGQVWTEVGRVRRIAAEWNHAGAALRRSEEHLSRGSGDPLLKGRLRSVAASLLADQGRYREALAVLEECQTIYEEARAWPLVARTLVKAGNTLVDHDPERALVLAEKALPMIPANDPVLRWLAESVCVESLIEMGEMGQALQAFQIAESLRSGHARADAGRRSNFTAARLLEGLGHFREAEMLFEAVIAEGFEREAYREAFLDILYLFGMHVRRGETEKAVALCRLALARLDLFGVGHEQLRAVWVELRDAATRRAIRLESLGEVREFVRVHWKSPAPKTPRITSE